MYIGLLLVSYPLSLIVCCNRVFHCIFSVFFLVLVSHLAMNAVVMMVL